MNYYRIDYTEHGYYADGEDAYAMVKPFKTESEDDDKGEPSKTDKTETDEKTTEEEKTETKTEEVVKEEKVESLPNEKVEDVK